MFADFSLPQPLSNRFVVAAEIQHI